MNRRLFAADATALTLVALGFAVAVTSFWHLVDYSSIGPRYHQMLGTVIANHVVPHSVVICSPCAGD
jgi:hypothetical protein